jgi:simple sugar transport system permease protein
MLSALQKYRKGTHFFLLATIVIISIFLTVDTARFLTLSNLFNLLTSYAYLGILSAGLLVVLISGAIDISFTATAAISQYVMMSVCMAYGGDWVIAFLIAGAVGIVLGAINAVLVHYLRISSIIITIATLNIFFGILIFVTHGDYLDDLPDWFQKGLTLFTFQGSNGQPFSMSLQIMALAITFAVTWFMLERTSLGRQIYALGSNPDAAARLGFNILRLRLIVFAYMGLLAGIASVIQAQLTMEVSPEALMGRELDVMAAVVLGGASLAGGVGSVVGTILGVVLLAIIQNGSILMGVSSYWSQVLVGAVIITSVSGSAWNARRGPTGMTVNV